jgi:hypothetical protein
MFSVSKTVQTPEIVYVMACVPTPATEGLNMPAPLTPDPVQSPPGVAAVSVTDVLVTQNGPVDVMVGSGEAETTIFSESDVGQGPPIE